MALTDPRQLFNWLINIQTAVPRLWTAYPTGLTVSGVSYSYADIRPDVVTMSSDGTLRKTVKVTIGNSQNIATDLVNNYANRWKPVTVQMVRFNEDWTINRVDLWFTGHLSQPRFQGEFVILTCSASQGRTGQTPTMTMDMSLTSHSAPPPDAKY
jgi:hypothetical protein